MVTSSAISSESAWLGAGARSSALGGGAALKRAFVFLLVSTTVLERIGVNFGSYSLNAAMLGMYGFLAVAALSGVVMLSATRVFLYGVGVVVAIASAMLNGDRSSSASLLLLAAMYLPYAFVLRPNTSLENDRAWTTNAFSNVAFFVALAGIAQFYAQFVIHSDWLFDFSDYLPSVLRGPAGFNTVIPVGALRKSNGFFFREPSGFSFVMGLALIVEAVSYRRLLRFMCFGLALLLTYSGTGLLALLLGLLFPLGRKTILRLLTLGCVSAIALWLLGDVLNLSFTLDRATEFGSEQSSGYIRYIAPLRLVRDTFNTHFWTPWIGHGPGTISREIQGYEFHDPTWAKLLFEYGVVGTVAFLALFLVALRRRDVPVQIRAVLFFGWLIMGGHLLSPEQNFLTLAMVGLVPCAPRLDASRRPDSAGRSTTGVALCP
jgi:hypothetical protein